jgi:hypothetical protein
LYAEGTRCLFSGAVVSSKRGAKKFKIDGLMIACKV